MIPAPKIDRCDRHTVDRFCLALEREIGPSLVRRDEDALREFARDESEVEPTLPDVVVFAHSLETIANTLRLAEEHRIYVTPRAGGTGRTGGAVPVGGGVVLATHGMDTVKEIDTRDMLAVVGPGIITSEFHAAVEKEGLFYPPDPNSLKSCRIGGNLAENAGGPRAFKYGVTREYVLGLEAVTMGGHVLRCGKRTIKGVSGYDMTALFVGSEGTLGVFSEATLRLVRNPPLIATLCATYRSEAGAITAVQELLQRGSVPRAIEFMDRETLVAVRNEKVPVAAEASAMLLVELDGFGPGFDEGLSSVGETLSSGDSLEVLVAKNQTDRDRLWNARRALSPATKRLANHKLSEDVVVPRSQMLALLSDVRALGEKHRVRHLTYGHAGDGNLHVNFLWDHAEERPAIDAALDALMRAVVARGGTLTGEHGIGVTKLDYLSYEQSPALISAQQSVKRALDPHGLLNPGKIFYPRPHSAC